MRVLILDPNIINQHYLKTKIEEAGILTDVSSSIEEVEMFMFSNKAELLIMASETLSTAELQAIRKWRREGRTIRIMILNSSNNIEHKVKAFESGADDYVVKSSHIEEIIIRIWVLVRRNYLTPSSRITAGNLELDLNSKVLFINKQKIRLTRFEFEIMKLLVKNKGKALSKRKIMKHLYHDWMGKENNTVEVLIGRLRKKLAPYNSGQIRNQREEGYYYDLNGAI